MFETNHALPGTLESRLSRGSSTVEFLRGNFHSRDLLDTVYVTANPKLHEHRDDIDTRLHAVRDVWRDGWDETHNTVLPEQTTAAAVDAAAAFPTKRSVVHYIQPHYPFLAGGNPFDSEQAFLRPDEPGSWHQVMTGELSVSRERVWDAYVATLDRALTAVEDLLSEIKGKTVVTADHGNMVGERARPVPVREWGHPTGVYTSELVRVPWHVYESGADAGSPPNRRRANPTPSTTRRSASGSASWGTWTDRADARSEPAPLTGVAFHVDRQTVASTSPYARATASIVR